MAKTAKQNRALTLAVTTALATTLVAGCTTQAAPPANLSASQAQAALSKGKSSNAVGHAESAVKADPHNASFRAMLGASYMESGRFQSAATSFNDAMQLGDDSARTALSYALAEIASNNPQAAMRVLTQRRADLDPADLGLALALAGDPNQGVTVLGNALRGGYNTPKVRQNLAYAYALQGNWRAARLMASEDVPANEINNRIAEWAQAVESHTQVRVAKLLSVPVVGDSGQPAELALVNNPSGEALAAEAVDAPKSKASPENYAYAAPVGGELPAVGSANMADAGSYAAPAPDTVTPVERADLAPLVRPTAAPSRSAPRVAQVAPPSRFESAFPQRSADNAAKPSVEPELPGGSQPIPVAKPKPRVAKADAAPVRASSKPSAGGSHLVQLGSFSSEASAKRAWGIYLSRYPQLSDGDLVITKAKVRGKIYYRVSAAGFASASAQSMCSKVRSGGHGCITWAEGKPLPGALDRGIRMASR